jgi:hypothetical protein
LILRQFLNFFNQFLLLHARNYSTMPPAQ